MVRARFPFDPMALAALRAIRETEAFLEASMGDDAVAPRIPVIRVGCGTFPARLSAEFWSAALELDET